MEKFSKVVRFLNFIHGLVIIFQRYENENIYILRKKQAEILFSTCF
jgi:hypothetical protein